MISVHMISVQHHSPLAELLAKKKPTGSSGHGKRDTQCAFLVCFFFGASVMSGPLELEVLCRSDKREAQFCALCLTCRTARSRLVRNTEQRRPKSSSPSLRPCLELAAIIFMCRLQWSHNVICVHLLRTTSADVTGFCDF